MVEITAGYTAIEAAYWKWVNENCPHTSPRARGKWMHANQFHYDGTTWIRESYSNMSNSGKTVMSRETSFKGADGRVEYVGGFRKNRSNDPDRNWGLGRE